MIYVVVGNYEVYNPGSGYSDLIDFNQYVTDDKADLKNMKQPTYTYEDMSNNKKYTVVPYSLDVQVWENGKQIAVHDFKKLEDLKGWANE